jgi:LCP family protein required for cell wall assembly
VTRSTATSRPRPRRTALLAGLVAAMLVVPGIASAAGRILAQAPAGKVTTILLLGSDDGPPRDGDPAAARADAIHLVFLAPDRQHATFVSFPRDSWVPVTGLGTTKINACLTRGPENCVTTMEALFGITIDGYLLTSMWGFAEAVNEFVGCPPGPDAPCQRGLTIDVQDPCSENCGGVPIPQRGIQQLTGYESLSYARHRKTRPGGDFARSQAQAEILTIAHEVVLQDGGLLRAMDALRIMRRHVITDLEPAVLARLAVETMNLTAANVRREFAPSRLGTEGEASVVFLEPATKTLVADAAADGRVGP